MGQYHTKGLYNTYKKNNKERDALDYYATPPEEVTNILNVLNLDLSCSYILEPCSGGGHMVKEYLTILNLNRIVENFGEFLLQILKIENLL